MDGAGQAGVEGSDHPGGLEGIFRVSHRGAFQGGLQGSGLAAALVRDSDDPVNLDQEMVKLSTNQLEYQASVTMLMKKLGQLKTVIEGDSQ